MSGGTKWFDRSFSFPYPLELLPNLRVRLRGTPVRLEEALRSQARERLIARTSDKWSALEEAGHLTDLEPLWLARVDDYVSGGDRLTPADLTNRKTHEANHNVRPTEEILTEFRSARTALLRHVKALDLSLFERAIPHPRLGTPMRLADHLYFVAEHDDHHLAHIHELLGTP